MNSCWYTRSCIFIEHSRKPSGHMSPPEAAHTVPLQTAVNGGCPISLYWAPLRQERVAPVSTNAAGDVIPISTGIRAPLTPLSLILFMFTSFMGGFFSPAPASSGCHCSASVSS